MITGSLSKFQGALPRLLGLVPHSGRAAVEVGALASLRTAPLTEVPTLFSSMISRTPNFTSAGVWEDNSPAGDQVASKVVRDAGGEELEGEETVLTLPTDLKLIGSINPELRRVMEAHATSASDAAADVRQQLEALLSQAHDGKAAKVNKTNLNKLRVDQLRQQLVAIHADARGTKAVLVQRLLQLAEDAGKGQAVVAGAEGMGEGVVSSKALARQGKMMARQAATAADHGMSNAALRVMQAAAVAEAAAYSRVFDPHEVARLLSDARAEDVAIVDVRGHCAFADYMVLATGRSSQIVHMLAAAVLHELKQRCKEVAPGVAPGVEGGSEASAEWLVVDAGSVVVHVFVEGARREYNLEALWGRGGNITRVAPRKAVQTLDTIRA